MQGVVQCDYKEHGDQAPRVRAPCPGRVVLVLRTMQLTESLPAKQACKATSKDPGLEHLYQVPSRSATQLICSI